MYHTNPHTRARAHIPSCKRAALSFQVDKQIGFSTPGEAYLLFCLSFFTFASRSAMLLLLLLLLLLSGGEIASSG